MYFKKFPYSLYENCNLTYESSDRIRLPSDFMYVYIYNNYTSYNKNLQPHVAYRIPMHSDKQY